MGRSDVPAMMRHMPYPGEFYRIVAIGKLYDDVFNFSLSMVPTALGEITLPPIDQSTLEARAQVFQTWFAGNVAPAGPRISEHASLTSLKVNRISPDGHYADPETMEYVYDPPIKGGGTGFTLPAQLATAVTLRTAVPRGRGSHGRFYLPPNFTQGGLGTDGRSTPAQALALAKSCASLIRDLNGIGTLVSRVGVASNAGAGRFEHVTSVSVGRVVDTIRSRRSALTEDYQTVII